MTDTTATDIVETTEAAQAEKIPPEVIEAIAEATAEAEAEAEADDDPSIASKVAHTVAAPVKGLIHGVNRVFDRFVIRLERTNDVRRGRKVVAAAQRRALADMGKAARHDSKAT